MRIRTILLAGATTAALSAGPAFANDTQGWYIGLGVGYDHQEPVRIRLPQPWTTDARIGHRDNAMVLGAFGYKWDNGLRVEFEPSYSWHDTHEGVPPSAGIPLITGTFTGSNSLGGALVNFIYDWDLCPHWSLSLGGGVGAGNFRESEIDHNIPGIKFIRGQTTGLMWQGILGLNYEFDPDTELFIDYRYRSAQIDHNYASDWVAFSPIHVDPDEHVAVVGIRWFIEEAPPPPPPPPPPAPAVPPPPPPPVKTFIVFFDFDKSNLTEKAQEVVAEAVRVAKANGFVKVLVTGHTDTVGSDSYNQALSIRRAESVKDAMVGLGMNAGDIAIDGKSFHDPLVPTGPGVREPQNRRAVIDLGG